MSLWSRFVTWMNTVPDSGEAAPNRFVTWMNTVPDCPSCRGTGEAAPNQIDELVYWKGRIVRVCFQCKGAGKV